MIGSILQHYVPVLLKADDAQKKVGQLGAQAEASSAFPPETASLKGAFRAPAAVVKGAPSYAYEARVLEGIWAAPYLHNGSVPTLAELLKPAAERVRSFKVGPAYDLVNVGLAVQQSKFDHTLETTDCSDRNSGNSRCGHEFGTTLSEEKKALLEYLKTL